MREIEVTIEGMTCQHCVMAVRNALSRLPRVDVKDVRIGSARIAIDESRVTLTQVADAIRDAGYTARV